MADIDNTTRDQLETILEMSGGYVLDFTNGSFADFIRTCLGFDPYEHYDGSKAVILRAIWRDRTWPEVAKLNQDLLERWVFMRGKGSRESTLFETELHQSLIDKFTLAPKDGTIADTDLAFLERDLGDIDLLAFPRALTACDAIRARLDEIDRCLEVNAPLAVIFLVGSTLEGLFLDLATAQSRRFVACDSAPRTRDGRVKPLEAWTLAELIQVAHALGIVGKDVHGHVGQVRNFRNYIHPREQMRSGFLPRLETARIARLVLLAALNDFQAFAGLVAESDGSGLVSEVQS